MSALQPVHNDTLPFDVLGDIFSHYALEETFRYPLETLLLVCRAWADAALGHRALWSQLNIYLGHYPTCRSWDVRLPLRLERAGPETPLDIDIRTYLAMPRFTQTQEDVQNDILFDYMPCNPYGRLCKCPTIARASAHRALERITGASGKFCARWRSLKLNLGHREDGIRGTERVAINLSYPTPLLTTLALNNVQFDDDISLHIFPYIPLLRNITVVDCHLPSLPPVGDVRVAVIGWKENLEDFQDLSAFSQAVHVHKLHLNVPFGAGICIPDQLLELWDLHITGDNFPHDLYYREMPLLSKLTLEYQHQPLLSHILNLKGLAPPNLRHVTLRWQPPLDLKSEHIRENATSLQRLLSLARNLQDITTGKEILNILLKVIWEFANAGPLSFAGICVINSTTDQRVHLRSDEKPERIEEIANEWGLLPLHGPMAQFASSMEVSRH